MNLYSEINLKISQFQQHLNNFENRLHDHRLPSQLSLLKIQEVASCLETLSKSAKSQKAHTLGELKATIVVLKCDFEHKLVSSAEKLIELAQNGILASDANLKAQRLLSMAQSSLNSPQISEAFRQQLETIIINLNVLLGSQEIQEKSDLHARLSKVNDNSGILQFVLTHLNLTLKEIGPLSQVSKGLSKLCNNESLWENKCKTYPYVELNNLQRQKTYKNLYKSETAFLKFKHNFDFPLFMLMQLDTSALDVQGLDMSKHKAYLNLRLGPNLYNDKFRIKHLKKYIQVQAPQYAESLINNKTSLSDIKISYQGKEFKDSQKVSEINWSTLQDITKIGDNVFLAPIISLRKPSENNMEIDTPPQSQAARYASIINLTARGGIKADEEMVKQFMQRGGNIQILEGGQTLTLNRNHRFIVADRKGIDMSQATRAFLIKYGCNVELPINSLETGMNPLAEGATYGTTYFEEDEIKGFKDVFGCDKVPVLGQAELEDINVWDIQYHKNWFQSYFDSLKTDTPVHFICYSSGATAVMHRLLARKGDLKGFTLTFMAWNNVIQEPSKQGIESYSKEAYQDLMNKLQKRIRFES